MNDDLFIDSIRPMFADLSERFLGPNNPCAAEAWAELADSGFLRLLLPEYLEGGELTPTQALPVLMAAGYYCLPLPFVETVLLGIALGEVARDDRALATGKHVASGALQPLRQDLAHLQALVIDTRLGCALIDVGGNAAQGWQALAGPRATDTSLDLHLLGTAAECLQLAGAMQRVLELTVDYANTRQQFGRAIGKYQALQQQISVMTGQCHSAVMAAQLIAAGIHCGEGTMQLDTQRIAAACGIIKAACQPVVSTAHAVHGAIGVTQEYRLHHYSRRLLAGRLAGGSESWWFEQVGRACLQSGERVFDFARETLS